MWDTADLPAMEQLNRSEQLWIIALAVETARGPTGYVLALREIAEHLEETGWWLSESRRTEI